MGDLAEIVRGASPRPISDPKWFDNDSSVGWLRIADVTAQDGRIRYLEQKISELGQEKTRVIKTPHLLLSIAATVGKPVINYVPTGVHDGFLIFLNPKFNILYTFWWLEMFREKWNKYGQPGSQVNLNSDLVKNQVINIPNEKEQDKISSFLESLDKIITLHQRKLEKLKLAKKALLQKLFPKNGSKFPELRFKGFADAWEQRELSSLTKYIGTGKSRFVIKEFGEYAILGSTNVIGYDDAYDYDGNFILTARVGANAGQLYRYSGKVKITDNTVFLMSDRSQFIYYALTHFDLRRLSFGTGQPLVKSSELQKLKLCVPVSKSEQEKIGEIFNNIDNIITLHQQKPFLCGNSVNGGVKLC